MSTVLRRTPVHVLRAARAGFTLIELLAVMLIIGILMAFLVPQIPAVIDRANVTACKANLRDIGGGLLEYRAKYKKMPTEPGVGFFTALITDKVWESTEAASKKLTCPGIEYDSLGGIAGVPAEEWYIDRDVIDGSFSAYAGRDVREHAIRKYPISGKEALVGDDNDPDGNHRTETCILMGDGNVKSYQLVEEQKKGLVDEEELFLIVGPESPIEALQKLSLD